MRGGIHLVFHLLHLPEIQLHDDQLFARFQRDTGSFDDFLLLLGCQPHMWSINTLRSLRVLVFAIVYVVTF